MLSFNDSGKVLANLLGVTNFEMKVAVLQEFELKLQMSPDCVIYVGDSSSYLCLMYDVNSRAVQTIAVSETKSISRICQ